MCGYNALLPGDNRTLYFRSNMMAKRVTKKQAQEKKEIFNTVTLLLASVLGAVAVAAGLIVFLQMLVKQIA